MLKISLLFLLTVIGCGSDSSSELAIINGQSSKDPASGRLFVKTLVNDGSFNFSFEMRPICSASGVVLDGKNYILSAAHCFSSLTSLHLDDSAKDYQFKFEQCDRQVSLTKVFRSLGDAAFIMGSVTDQRLVQKYGDFAIATFTSDTPVPERCFAKLNDKSPVADQGIVLHGMRNMERIEQDGAFVTRTLEGDRQGIYERATKICARRGLLAVTSTPILVGGDSGGRVSVSQSGLTFAVNSFKKNNKKETVQTRDHISIVTPKIVRKLLLGKTGSQTYPQSLQSFDTGWHGLDIPSVDESSEIRCRR